MKHFKCFKCIVRVYCGVIHTIHNILTIHTFIVVIIILLKKQLLLYYIMSKNKKKNKQTHDKET